jgi:3-oxoacyl-[acyl-carrier protein] reductase
MSPGPAAVVTGGTRGLGRHLTLELARNGYRVLALWHADEGAAAELDRMLAAEGLSGRAFRHDVVRPAHADGVWAQPEVLEADALVFVHNAAAAFEPRPMHLLDWEDFQTGLDVGPRGLFQCALGALRPMLSKGGGTIVSVSSTALSAAPPKGFAAYLVAKGAQEALTRSIAAEHGARGVRTIGVSPGFMRTPMTDSWHPALRDAILGTAPAADPAGVAARIRALIEDPTIPGCGESYDV